MSVYDLISWIDWYWVMGWGLISVVCAFWLGIVLEATDIDEDQDGDY